MNKREETAVGEIVINKQSLLLCLEISPEGDKIGVPESPKNVHVSSEFFKPRVPCIFKPFNGHDEP